MIKIEFISSYKDKEACNPLSTDREFISWVDAVKYIHSLTIAQGCTRVISSLRECGSGELYSLVLETKFCTLMRSFTYDFFNIGKDEKV